MPFLRILFSTLGYALYAYTLIVFVFSLLSWFSGPRNTKFYYVLSRICDPFERIFGGKLIVGMFDLGGTLGLIMLAVISQFLISLSYRF